MNPRETQERPPFKVDVQGLERPCRLDKFLRERYPHAGRQAVQALVTRGKVSVNGRHVWLSSWLVHNGDTLLVFEAPEPKPQPPEVFDDGWLIAEENDLIAANKPAGLLSEPTRWTKPPSLLSLAVIRFGTVSLFHRLDRDTSGVVILTRNGPVNRYLDAAFKEGRVEKVYIAVVSAPNNLSAQGEITLRICPHPRRHDMMAITDKGGVRAVTRYQVIQESGKYQWIRLWPQTGRTHQLRVHLAHMGAPILGDRLYNPLYKQHSRLMLHATKIALPAEGIYPSRSYTAPLPGDFALSIGTI